jgi:hypothetical protein
MEIFVTVNCLDKTIKILLADLMKHDYFKMMLSNFSTKMTCEVIKTINQNGVEKFFDVYTIPHISLDCDSKVLITLLNNQTIHIDLNEITPFLFELLYYNGLFGTNVVFTATGTQTMKFVVHFNLAYYIKTNSSNLNVYDFLEKGGLLEINELIYETFMLVYHNQQLSEFFITDLIEKIDKIIVPNMDILEKDNIALNEISSRLIHILDFITRYYKDNRYNGILKNKINNVTIEKILNIFFELYRQIHNGIRIDGTTRNYNMILSQIEKLYELKIIDKSNIKILA